MNEDDRKKYIEELMQPHIPLRVLQEIRQEIENNMESIIGKYDANTPEHNRPSHKIERNNGRKECLAIIDKHIKEYME